MELRDPPPPTTSSLWSGSSCSNLSPWLGNAAYLPDEADRAIWQPITLKVNFIFWTNPNLPNGDIGNFNPSDLDDMAFLDGLEEEVNRRISNLVDPNDEICSDQYVKDANIRFDFERYWIADAYLWDLENQGTGNTDYCPHRWDFTNSGTPYTNQVNQRLFEHSVRNGINVFFANEGSPYYQLIVNEVIQPSSGGFCGVASCTDCSELPSTANLNKKSRVAMNNEYLGYKYGKDIMQNSDFNQEQHKLAVSRVLLHELGHSFDMGHYNSGSHCPDRNIMASIFGTQGNYLNKDQIGQMHRISHISSLRQYAVCREPDADHDPLKDLPRIISGNERWNFDTKLYTNLVVESGGELTLCGKLYMPKDGYIWVKRGGKLIVDGGLISHKRDDYEEDCPDAFWSGIIVQGNANRDHASVDIENLLPDDPGVVIIENGAKIEYAGSGVATKHSQQYYWLPEYFGGIVQASNSTFLNCRRAGEFMRYDRPNASFFKGCTIESTEGSAFAGVTMWRTRSIVFDDCDFINLGDYGLLFYDAGGIVMNGCVFESTENGIYATATMPLSSPLIIGMMDATGENRNSFEQNSCGINAMGLSRLIVQNNDFKANGHGLAVTGLSGGLSYNNTYTQHQASEQYTSAGILGKVSNCNEFNQENFGILALGGNYGLTFSENDFEASYGMLLLGQGNSLGSIFPEQGNRFVPADNLFPSNGNAIFTDANTVSFDYYYRDDSDPRFIPPCAINDASCQEPFNFYRYHADESIPPNSECLDYEGFQVCETKLCFEERYAALDSLETFIDGGDREGLLYAIQHAAQSGSTEQMLIAASPYLSDDVLITAALSNMSTAAKENTLLANAPLSDSLMSQVGAQVSPQVEQSLIAIKNSIPQSERNKLEADIRAARHDAHRALYSLVLRLIEDEDYAEADTILASTSNLAPTLPDRIAVHIMAGNQSEAQSLLDSLPQGTAREQAHHYLLSITAEMNRTDTFALSTQQESELYSIAASSMPERAYAMGLLSQLKGEIFMPSIPVLPTQLRAMPTPPQREDERSRTRSALNMSMQPNPAKDVAYFRWEVPVEQAATLQIIDALGRPTERIALKPGSTSFELNTQRHAPGLYFAVLSYGDKQAETLRFLITK